MFAFFSLMFRDGGGNEIRPFWGTFIRAGSGATSVEAVLTGPDDNW